LRELKQLETLKLDFTERELTDKGIKQLKGLTKLKTLNLSFSALTDDGLRHLSQLKNLENSIVEGTNVTAKGVADLHCAIPKVMITHQSRAAECSHWSSTHLTIIRLA